MNESEFIDHYKESQTKLFRWVMRRARNVSVANDICAETFKCAWANRSILNGNFNSWCHTVAYRIICMQHRHDAIITATSLDDPENSLVEQVGGDDSALDNLETAQSIKCLNAYIVKLPKRQQAVIARWLSGKSCQGTYGSRLHKAKYLLRKRLNFYG